MSTRTGHFPDDNFEKSADLIIWQEAEVMSSEHAIDDQEMASTWDAMVNTAAASSGLWIVTDSCESL